MKSENKDLPLNLEEVDKSSGEVVNLAVNSTSTVQPVALMRLGLFVPTLKSTGKSKANRKNVTDATDELIQLSVARSEGYTDVKITGSRLDMDTDFKVWLGIIRSMSEYGVKKIPWNFPLLSSLKCADSIRDALTRRCAIVSAIHFSNSPPLPSNFRVRRKGGPHTWFSRLSTILMKTSSR